MQEINNKGNQKENTSSGRISSAVGADDGNRTRITGVEGRCSAVELHPQRVGREAVLTGLLYLRKGERYSPAGRAPKA